MVLVIDMLYNILGIIIGVFILLNSIFLIKSKRINAIVWGINLFCSFGFIATGIGGFFFPESLNYVPIILLFVFSLIFLVQYSIFLKKNKESK